MAAAPRAGPWARPGVGPPHTHTCWDPKAAESALPPPRTARGGPPTPFSPFLLSPLVWPVVFSLQVKREICHQKSPHCLQLTDTPPGERGLGWAAHQLLPTRPPAGTAGPGVSTPQTQWLFLEIVWECLPTAASGSPRVACESWAGVGGDPWRGSIRSELFSSPYCDAIGISTLFLWRVPGATGHGIILQRRGPSGGGKLSPSPVKPDLEESAKIEKDAALLSVVVFLILEILLLFYKTYFFFMSVCNEFIILTLNQGFSTLAGLVITR